ncbi:hypothetical protein GCM10025876_04850 [Demequina litorisediminis]|uniref:Uncharacterized protein n=1 Tax=Demequina litorisediminis TaxID=1849022 RepID=A0ABQ6IA02_9MICO|nr:hypothetical protein GCM10025876_04850 [Demequina litorisediminis]
MIRAIDRYLMLYIRTADRLQRTAPWQAEYEGGLEAIREVVLEDSSASAPTSTPTWPTTSTPTRTSGRPCSTTPSGSSSSPAFVNAPETADPSLAYVEERGQRRPATPAERVALVGSASLEEIR